MTHDTDTLYHLLKVHKERTTREHPALLFHPRLSVGILKQLGYIFFSRILYDVSIEFTPFNKNREHSIHQCQLTIFAIRTLLCFAYHTI